MVMTNPTSMNTNLVEYYRLRALEYEAVYQKPERRNDLQTVGDRLKDVFAGLDVLEVACGTGYWTQRIAETANSVAASDINEEVLAVAKAKSYGCPVTFGREDLYRPAANMPPAFDGLFGGFIWSHIPREQLKKVLESLAKRVNPAARSFLQTTVLWPAAVHPSIRKMHRAIAGSCARSATAQAPRVEKIFLPQMKSGTPFPASAVWKCRNLTYFWMAECRIISNNC